MTLLRAETWPEQGEWTYEAWARLPDDGARYEVIDGVLYVTPAPSIEHQFRSNQLTFRMTAHVEARSLGVVLAAPVDVLLPGQAVPVEPDIVFVSAARRHLLGQQNIEGAPDLVVEVLSPSNWPYDRNTKFKLYQSVGIPEYWIVDYRAKTVEVFVLRDGEYVLEQGVQRDADIARSAAMTGFEIVVGDIFQAY